jgi:cytochrome c2
MTGRKKFAKKCKQCHVLRNGETIGPDHTTLAKTTTALHFIVDLST